MALGLGALAACSEGGNFDPEAAAARFIGGAAADEPRAVLVAESILARGGSAADAATALFFTLSVTYPVAAGLGGGGACTVYDAANETSESLSFLPRAAAEGGAVAVPGAVRGFASLHARFGRLRWEEVVLPAEELARFGHPVSRALVRRVEDSGIAGHAGAALGRLFAPLGAPIAEGTRVEQVALASVLSRIRTRGGGDLYFGGLARDFVAGVRAVGGRVSPGDLRDFLPRWQASAATPAGGDLVLYSPPGAPNGGLMAATVAAALMTRSRYEESDAAERPHLLAQASARVFAAFAAGQARSVGDAALLGAYEPGRHTTAASPIDLGAWAGPGDDGTTSFAVVDGRGSAVVCGVTMNGEFGTGEMVSELGIVLAPPAGDGPASWPTSGGDFLATVLLVDPEDDAFLFAGTAAGGPAAPLALIQVILASLIDELPAHAGVARPRLFHFAQPDVVFAEAGVGEETRRSLRQRGHVLRPIERAGRVNAVVCSERGRRSGAPCGFAADGRGYGTATGAGFE